MINQNTKWVIILGPTASGKTDLSLRLAREFDGEIICADSKTFYRGMDIGTAKPSLAEQKLVPHHLIDILEPGEVLGAPGFKQMAEAAIASIASRGRVPFLVGGSGLYIDSVLYDYQFPEPSEHLEPNTQHLSLEQLVANLGTADPAAFEAIDLNNRRRVERALQTVGQSKSRLLAVPGNVLVLGTVMNKESVQSRISERIEKMLEEGFLDEVSEMAKTYGWESEAMSGIGYRAFRGVVEGTETLEAGKQKFIQGDLRLVKKQLTWFKRNQSVHWLEDPHEASAIVRRFLAQESV